MKLGIRGIPASKAASGSVVARGRFSPRGLAVAALLVGSLSVAAHAEENVFPANAPATTLQVSAFSSIELWLAAGIILFGLIVLLMQFALLWKSAGVQPADILRLFTVTMVVIGTMSLIAIGYSSQQIAPALGLFGTILGYLLGRTDERMRERKKADAGDDGQTPARP